MNGDSDFYQQINDNFRLTTIQIIYYLPDYRSILQEFLWQTLDKAPEYPRMHKFLRYWEENIEAPIYSAKIANVEIISPANVAYVTKEYQIKH